ncbi:MAG: histidine kinase, partial [Bacteroidetes bacterium]|nr:histidine kinase [Bacteroidota bacterium]
MNLKSVIAPITYITGFAIAERDTVLTDNLVLKYNQNNIRIAIDGLSYSSRGHFNYKYRMIGLDSNWIETNSRNNFARFSSLPPGSYTFEVAAVNENGLASKPAMLHFSINKPFWFQWWFIASVLLVVGITVLWIYTVRLNSVKNKAKVLLDKTLLEQNLRASELTALKAQMNPHFIFNALNSIQEFILLNDKQTAQKYLGKFSDLMRLYLDMSQHQTISLDDEIKTLKLYLELESIRFEDSFTYHLHIGKNILGEDKKIPPMIIQPYIENALKHGLLHKKNNRELRVSFELQNEQTLLCVVEDNGIGREASFEINQKRIKKFSSFSTGATSRRLELLNHGRTRQIGVTYTDMKDAEGHALGTQVQMLIPLD